MAWSFVGQFLLTSQNEFIDYLKFGFNESLSYTVSEFDSESSANMARILRWSLEDMAI